MRHDGAGAGSSTISSNGSSSSSNSHRHGDSVRARPRCSRGCDARRRCPTTPPRPTATRATSRPRSTPSRRAIGRSGPAPPVRRCGTRCSAGSSSAPSCRTSARGCRTWCSARWPTTSRTRPPSSASCCSPSSARCCCSRWSAGCWPTSSTGGGCSSSCRSCRALLSLLLALVARGDDPSRVVARGDRVRHRHGPGRVRPDLQRAAPGPRRPRGPGRRHLAQLGADERLPGDRPGDRRR